MFDKDRLIALRCGAGVDCVCFWVCCADYVFEIIVVVVLDVDYWVVIGAEVGEEGLDVTLVMSFD